MPTYVYKILKTGKKFEVEQRITEAAWSKHPETGEAVERVIQASGIVFKGSGFYKTDSRPSEKSGSKKDKKPDSDSGSSDLPASTSADSSTATSSSDSSTVSSDSSRKTASTDASKPAASKTKASKKD
jgi:putative FmdB family regulatory protein